MLFNRHHQFRGIEQAVFLPIIKHLLLFSIATKLQQHQAQMTKHAESLAKAADGDTWADSVEENTADRERRRATRSGDEEDKEDGEEE